MPTEGRSPETSRPAGDATDRLIGAASSERSADRARLFCLLDPWADRLLPALRSHFALDPRVAVLVERRAPSHGRPHLAPAQPTYRRRPVAERDVTRAVPGELRTAARHLRLVQPLAPLSRTYENTDIVALVAMTVALEPEATSELWWRISPRMLARLALCDGRIPDASTARALLGRMLDEATGFDPAREPLSAWLDALVDRFARERATATPPMFIAGQPPEHPALRGAA